MRLIDADALEKAIENAPTVLGGINLYKSMPTIDAVPVVRCQECKNWMKTVPGGLGACSFHKANLVTGEGFCYWGQRREDGDGA